MHNSAQYNVLYGEKILSIGFLELHCWSLCVPCGFWADLKYVSSQPELDSPTLGRLIYREETVGAETPWNRFKSAQKPHSAQRDQQWSPGKPFLRPKVKLVELGLPVVGDLTPPHSM